MSRQTANMVSSCNALRQTQAERDITRTTWAFMFKESQTNGPESLTFLWKLTGSPQTHFFCFDSFVFLYKISQKRSIKSADPDRHFSVFLSVAVFLPLCPLLFFPFPNVQIQTTVLEFLLLTHSLICGSVGLWTITGRVRHRANVPSLYWRAPFITFCQICRQTDTHWLHFPGLPTLPLHMFPFCASAIHFNTVGGSGWWMGGGLLIFVLGVCPCEK